MSVQRIGLRHLKLLHQLQSITRSNFRTMGPDPHLDGLPSRVSEPKISRAPKQRVAEVLNDSSQGYDRLHLGILLLNQYGPLLILT